MKRAFFTLGFFVLAVMFFNAGVQASPTSKVIQEVLEQAAKVSGKTLNPASKEAAELAMRKAIASHGDDILRIVREGGLETLEQGAKHGDDFWRLCAHSPRAARSLALHADDLLPIARRIGPEVAELEARAPGMTMQIAEHYGDDGIRALTKAPANDISKLVCGAQNADSPATRELLLNTYKKSKDGSKFLSKIDWKVVAASGLSAGVIISAYKVSDGVETAIEQHGSEVTKNIANTTRYVAWTLGIIFLLMVFGVVRPLLKNAVDKKIQKDKQSQKNEQPTKDEQSQKNKQPTKDEQPTK